MDRGTEHGQRGDTLKRQALFLC